MGKLTRRGSLGRTAVLTVNTPGMRLSYAREMLHAATRRWEDSRRRRLGKHVIFEARTEVLYWKRQVRKLVKESGS